MKTSNGDMVKVAYDAIDPTVVPWEVTVHLAPKPKIDVDQAIAISIKPVMLALPKYYLPVYVQLESNWYLVGIGMRGKPDHAWIPHNGHYYLLPVVPEDFSEFKGCSRIETNTGTMPVMCFSEMKMLHTNVH